MAVRPRGGAPKAPLNASARPLADGRAAPATPARADPRSLAEGRRVALTLVAVGLLWAGLTWAGGQFGWSQRLRALLDLFALAGFGVALLMTFRLWRQRRTETRG